MTSRIIDSEAHPITVTGAQTAYPMDRPWTYPFLPSPSPEGKRALAESQAAGDYLFVENELLQRMDAHGIEKCVIMGAVIPTRNEDLASIVERHPDRFVCFGSWDRELPQGNPPHETAASLSALEQGLTTHKLRGVGEVNLRRFQPLPPEEAYTGHIPTMELCRKYACPIFFHTGADTGAGLLLYRNPIYLEPLAAEYPEVPLILAHMGKMDTWFFEGALMMARKYKNVYLTTSGTRTDFVERAVEEVGPERILFGTDWSYHFGVLGLKQGFDVHEINLNVVRRANIDDRSKDLILGGSLATLLGI